MEINHDMNIEALNAEHDSMRTRKEKKSRIKFFFRFFTLRLYF